MKKQTKVLLSARIDGKVNAAIDKYCAASGIKKQIAVEQPLAVKYLGHAEALPPVR